MEGLSGLCPSLDSFSSRIPAVGVVSLVGLGPQSFVCMEPKAICPLCSWRCCEYAGWPLWVEPPEKWVEHGKWQGCGVGLLCKRISQAWAPTGTGKSVAVTIRHGPWTMATCWGCWRTCRHTGRRQRHCPRSR